jgi:type IVB pilus formation R64 PilN family outer membrane protein
MKRLLIMLVVASLVGCATVHESENNINKTAKESDVLQKASVPKQNRLIEIRDNYWVSTKEIPVNAIDSLPSAFKQDVSARGNGVAFAWLIGNLLGKHGIPSSYSSTVQRDLAISVDYRGNLYGALNAIATASTYHWTYRDGQVYWDDLDVRTWSVPMTPGASQYLSSVGGSVTTSIQGVSDSTGAAGSGGYSTTNGSSGSAPSGASNTGNTQQTQRRADAIDIWHDLVSSVRAMLSARGMVTVSQSTSTITVRDYPDRIESIDHFMKKTTGEMSRQVYFQVEVIEVSLHKDASYGIDWQVVNNALGGLGYGISTGNTGEVFPKYFTPPTLTLISTSNNPWGGSQALVKALETQGDVSVRTEPRVVTMNNQVAAVQVGTEIGYLARSETSFVAGSATATTALTPGVARSGFMMYLLPRVMPKNEIIMQMSVSINKVDHIRTVTSGSSSIELPDISTRNFQQLTRLQSGQSMVLAGFRQINNDRTGAGASLSLGWLFGSISGGVGRVDTVVVITPYVMNDSPG